jgi:hypothetical protein
MKVRRLAGIARNIQKCARHTEERPAKCENVAGLRKEKRVKEHQQSKTAKHKTIGKHNKRNGPAFRGRGSRKILGQSDRASRARQGKFLPLKTKALLH